MPYTPPPPQPRHYRRAAEELRRLAGRIEAHADAADPRGRGSLTSAIHGLARLADALSCRHRGTTPAARDARAAASVRCEIEGRIAEIEQAHADA